MRGAAAAAPFALWPVPASWCNFPPGGVFFRQQPILLMKTILSSVISASLLGMAYRFGGRPFDVIDFTAFLFATGLVTWTIEQYSHPSRVLLSDRPIRFPAQVEVVRTPDKTRRLAA
jgi:hypothetical protein